MFNKLTYLGALITIAATLSLVVMSISRQSSHNPPAHSSHKIFCQGWNPARSEYYMIRYAEGSSPNARLELLTKKSPNEEWHSKLVDSRGILGETSSSSNSGLERVAMKGESSQMRLQFHRSCTPLPQCNLEEITIPNKKVVDQDQRKYHELSQQALEARKATSRHMAQQTEIANMMTQAQTEVIAALAKEHLVQGKPLEKEWTASHQHPLVRAAVDYVAKSFTLSKKKGGDLNRKEKSPSWDSTEDDVRKALDVYESLLPRGTKPPTSYEQLNLSAAKKYESEIRERAHELTQRFHNLSAAAGELERKSQIFRETSSLAPVSPTITSLEPLEPEAWCP